MANFDFNNSNYALFWQYGNILKTYIDETPYLRTNFGFWQTQFSVDPTPTPTDDKGLASFAIQSVKREPAPMADMRAPLARGKALDWEGLHVYNASIPHFIAPSIHEQAFERAAKARVFEQYGNDEQIIEQWTAKVQGQMDSLNQTLSNMAAQVLSTGKINYNFGRAIQGMVYDAAIPKENIIKAGDKVWTDDDCPLLDQMAEIEDKFRSDNGYENLPMKWQIPYKMFHDTFLKNAQVKQFIKDYRTNNDMATTAGYVVTEDIFRTVVASQYPQISPIEVIVEKQKDYTGSVSGWKESVAVLRPTGYAGVIKHTEAIDRFMYENFGSTSVSKVFTKANGVFTLINTSLNNGDFKEWHTDMIMDAVPALDEVPYHLIVDTSQAGDGEATLS